MCLSIGLSRLTVTAGLFVVAAIFLSGLFNEQQKPRRGKLTKADKVSFFFGEGGVASQ